MEDKYIATLGIFGGIFGVVIVAMIMGVITEDGVLVTSLCTLAAAVVAYFFGQESGEKTGYERACRMK